MLLITNGNEFKRDYVKRNVPSARLLVTSQGFYQVKANKDGELLSGPWTSPDLAWGQAYTFLINR